MTAKYKQIQELIKKSMKNKDSDTLLAARNLKTKIHEHLVASLLPRDKVSDLVVETIAQTYRKSLKKAILEIENKKSSALPHQVKNLEETVAFYKKEVVFCDIFAPKQLGEAEIRTLVESSIKEIGSDHVGKLIGHVMKTNKDKNLDGAVVRKVVASVLSK